MISLYCVFIAHAFATLNLSSLIFNECCVNKDFGVFPVTHSMLFTLQHFFIFFYHMALTLYTFDVVNFIIILTLFVLISAKNEKPTPPKKPEGLLPMSSRLVLEMSSKSEPKVNHQQKRDGHYFFHIIDEETRKINDLLVQPLSEVDDKDIPEEAKGKIRSAIGKAYLLTSKKFSQFRELCEKNIVSILSEFSSSLRYKMT